MDAPESRARAARQAGPNALGLGPRDDRPALSPLVQRTLVEQVGDAIVRAAALGELLPGDRVVEADLARLLRVSRVPVREALRMLESQGVVVNTPYRGMRLMEVSADKLRGILKVRLELERLAARELLARPEARTALVAELDALCGAMAGAAARGDGYELARLDTEFHRALCRASGNEALLGSFEPLARQLTIIFGFSALQKDLASVVAEHVELCRAIERGDEAELMGLMKVHIVDVNEVLDHEAFIRSRRG
jgi:DNA-binding GntR family transcriptional regulator